MPTLLQIDFPYQGPYGSEMAARYKELAESIAREPGLIWKIWTESQSEQIAGGVYLFEDEVSARKFLEMHTARLEQIGVSGIRSLVLDVNTGLSAITHGPLQPAS